MSACARRRARITIDVSASRAVQARICYLNIPCNLLEIPCARTGEFGEMKVPLTFVYSCQSPSVRESLLNCGGQQAMTLAHLYVPYLVLPCPSLLRAIGKVSWLAVKCRRGKWVHAPQLVWGTILGRQVTRIDVVRGSHLSMDCKLHSLAFTLYIFRLMQRITDNEPKDDGKYSKAITCRMPRCT
jgi:hypothetical protein